MAKLTVELEGELPRIYMMDAIIRDESAFCKCQVTKHQIEE